MTDAIRKLPPDSAYQPHARQKPNLRSHISSPIHWLSMPAHMKIPSRASFMVRPGHVGSAVVLQLPVLLQLDEQVVIAAAALHALADVDEGVTPVDLERLRGVVSFIHRPTDHQRAVGIARSDLLVTIFHGVVELVGIEAVSFTGRPRIVGVYLHASLGQLPRPVAGACPDLHYVLTHEPVLQPLDVAASRYRPAVTGAQVEAGQPGIRRFYHRLGMQSPGPVAVRLDHRVEQIWPSGDARTMSQ